MLRLRLLGGLRSRVFKVLSEAVKIVVVSCVPWLTSAGKNELAQDTFLTCFCKVILSHEIPSPCSLLRGSILSTLYRTA